MISRVTVRDVEPLRVLVVDDEPVICDLLSLAFEKKQVEVVTAGTGEEAMERFQAGRFAGALVDKNLPGINGLEVVRRIRAADPEIALLMMTGYSSAESAEEALNLDVDAYLEKPFPQITVAVDRVLKAIGARRSTRALPVTPVRPRALLIALYEVRDWLIEAVGGGAEVTLAGTEDNEIIAGLSPPPDLVVVDAALFADAMPRVVAKVREKAPAAEIIVLSSAQMALGTLQTLIELGVRRLISHKNYGRPVQEALAKIRARQK